MVLVGRSPLPFWPCSVGAHADKQPTLNTEPPAAAPQGRGVGLAVTKRLHSELLGDLKCYTVFLPDRNNGGGKQI